jgi:mannosyl-oligosaccharide alpha-1,2-mannosidase
MSVLTGVLALLSGLYLGNPGVESALSYFRPMTQDSYWAEHRGEVKDVFVSSWDAYSKYAWGRLRLSVLSHVQLLGYPHVDNGKIKHSYR